MLIIIDIDTKYVSFYIDTQLNQPPDSRLSAILPNITSQNMESQKESRATTTESVF